ncbi:sialidase family protein [Corynebacterium kroppenstedtii]|uniref:exo-alpha-sialidase n=1 Tax=Corynebacterium kroppenstedtii TaxID=161879 RepID=A0A2W5SWE2_9CORY|nr:sialidase family protein [Corynebacterium kroppenstedtii]MDU7286845.1 sialidase family protein [Corynebacterium kroppenstedtii]PZR03886.1 MAG: sialidase [Corynebacterium kroppenstedtii]
MSTLRTTPYPAGSILARVRTTIDGPLIGAHTSAWELSIRIEDDHPHITTRTPDRVQDLDVEDATTITDGQWHSIALTVGPEGTKFYLDGYQAFCGTATAFLADVQAEELTIADGPVDVADVVCTGTVLSDNDVLAHATPPQPVVQFAANHLADYDTRRVARLRVGTTLTRFRVRGVGQGGTILSAGYVEAGGEGSSGAGSAGAETSPSSGDDVERLRLSVSDTGLTYEVLTIEDEWRTFAVDGHWADGTWHDVVIRAGEGSVDLYVDGFREARIPGQAFFADARPVNTITIGQDIHGRRLFGEVARAAIYPTPLTDGAIKRLSHVDPVHTQALFDRGMHGAVSYRIPSLLTLPSGTVIAGADQRTTIANDAPNDINFVIRRSLDGGDHWEDMQTILTYPGSGATGASVIDSCTVYDEDTGTVHLLIDHFPGAIGQPNNVHGVGQDSEGRLILTDTSAGVASDAESSPVESSPGTSSPTESSPATYVLNADGSVVTEDGKATEFSVDKEGWVTRAGQSAGNIYLADGEDPNQTLLTLRISYIVHVTSDDEGATWSAPELINHQVKEEWMAFLGTSPGTGVQLRHGEHAGRLVIPVYYSGDDPKHFSCAVIYSDDHGETWHRGASPNGGRLFKGATIDSRTLANDEASTHESTLVELKGGRLMVLMRNQHPSGRVATAISGDGGETWGEVTYHPDIPEIFSQPNAIAIDGRVGGAGSGESLYVFANASQLMPYRGNGVLRVSMDEGKTWPITRTFNPGHYVYQSIAYLPSGKIGLLWENEWQGLYFTQIPFNWFGPELQKHGGSAHVD